MPKKMQRGNTRSGRANDELREEHVTLGKRSQVAMPTGEWKMMHFTTKLLEHYPIQVNTRRSQGIATNVKYGTKCPTLVGRKLLGAWTWSHAIYRDTLVYTILFTKKTIF